MDYEYNFSTEYLEDLFVEEGFYRRCPNVITNYILSLNISDNAKCLYFYIYSRAHKQNNYSIHESNSIVSKSLNKNIRTVQRAYCELEKAGVIKRESKFDPNGREIETCTQITHPDNIANIFFTLPGRNEKKTHLKLVKNG